MQCSRGYVTILRWQIIDAFATDGDFALGDCLQPGDHVEQCAFATARTTDQNQEFAICNVEVDALQHLDAVGEGFANVPDNETGHALP